MSGKFTIACPTRARARNHVNNHHDNSGPASLDELIEKITFRAANEDGSFRAFLSAFRAEIEVPCDAFVIGEPVSVTAFGYDGNVRRGLTAACRREDGSEHSVAACDVVMAAREQGVHILEAYRHWLGLPPIVTVQSTGGRPPRCHKAKPEDLDLASSINLVVLSRKTIASRCRVLGSNRAITLRSSGPDLAVPGEIIVVRPKKQWNYSGHPYLSGDIESVKFDANALGLVPLSLKEFGEWNPSDHYWGEKDDPIEKWAEPIISHGPRLSYEMEQVLPGQNPASYDSDPIIEALELRDAGERGKATDLLMDLCQSDLRCLDAHAHLGNFAADFNPKEALRHYAVGVGIGELSLGHDFSGLLPWGLIDNRPFLRCLHGLGLCAWRLDRFEEALKIFTRLLWLNPTDNQGNRFNLDAVEKGQKWEPDPVPPTSDD